MGMANQNHRDWLQNEPLTQVDQWKQTVRLWQGQWRGRWPPSVIKEKKRGGQPRIIHSHHIPTAEEAPQGKGPKSLMASFPAWVIWAHPDTSSSECDLMNFLCLMPV